MVAMYTGVTTFNVAERCSRELSLVTTFVWNVAITGYRCCCGDLAVRAANADMPLLPLSAATGLIVWAWFAPCRRVERNSILLTGLRALFCA